MPEYTLVNPSIRGNIKTSFTGKSSLEAANKAYSTLSENFNNRIPKFYFTLQKTNGQTGGGNNNDYLHFLVTESKKGNQVNYRIVDYKPKNNAKALKNFKEHITKLNKEQEGGKRKKTSRKKKKKDDDDDDDDDYLDYDEFDDDDFPKSKKSLSYSYSYPITHWYYDPYIYSLTTDYYYLPTYVAPLAPYVSVKLPLYYP